MLFSRAQAAEIAAGTCTVTYRRWKRPQAVVGHRYRTLAGFIVVDAVDQVEAADVPAGIEVGGDPSVPITRVRFHLDDDRRDARAELADDTDVDVDAVAARLARLDARSPHGPWTRDALEVIAANPAVRAADLAASLGRERDEWKRDVRKLKAAGLTISLEVGYRLSPRGEAYLAAICERETPPDR